mmetsp:Transcript_124224/g.397351  ORF Transcript_124224/g.397351 Transcript_124224/m.397351 type:complete len:144 (-) Transcript_124224:522-953(-)
MSVALAGFHGRDPVASLTLPRSRLPLECAIRAPRAVFRLRVILAHLGTTLEQALEALLPVADESPAGALPSRPALPPPATSSALLPWPLADALGEDLRHVLLRAAACTVSTPRLAQHAAPVVVARQSGGRGGLSGVDRWWPAL